MKGTFLSLLCLLLMSHTWIPAFAVNAEPESKPDSVRIKELTMKLEEMRLHELLLQSKIDENAHHVLEDSLKRNAKREANLRQIDSLRAVTPGVPVVVEKDTLFKIYAARGGHSPIDRAEMTSAAIAKICDSGRLRQDSVYLLDNETYFDIMYGEKVIMSVTEQDALWHGVTVEELAGRLKTVISDKILQLQEEHSLWKTLTRVVMFVVVIFIQYLLVRLINWLFRRLRREIVRLRRKRIRPVTVHDYELLTPTLICRILVALSRMLRYGVLLVLFVLTIPILFSIFPQTEDLAYKIFDYILNPVKMMGKAILEYIPNLFMIAIIWICIRYIVKGIRYISNEVKNEKLRISGFYPDWAEPTFNIIRFLLYAFMIAMIYPYLPGSESGVFRGISIFVGVIVSLGSSSVISNFIAGFVITYMRPFKTGDFVKINETMGNVVEKSPFVTRVRTIKNELVTIPNSFITSSNTTNFSASARQYGLIIHTVLTMGYDVPWRRVHELLIDAALKTGGVLEHPAPFVLETELNDNYMCYQINAYIRNADEMPEIMSDLLQNIQDLFNDAGIELFAPHHFTSRTYVTPVRPIKPEASPLDSILGRK